MPLAICYRCGASKPAAPDTCSFCKLAPQTPSELARSFILSTQFDVGLERIGRTDHELTQIAAQISGGRPYDFDSAEIKMVASEISGFLATRPSSLLIDYAKWIGPPLLIVLVAIVLVLLRAP